MKKNVLTAVAIAILWGIPAALLAPRFPTVYIDEAENANHAFNLAFHHAAVFSLYDQLYPPSLAMLRQSWPVVIRPFFVVPLAIYFRSIGFSFLKARLFNVGVGALMLALIYLLVKRVHSQRAGVWAAAILGTRFAFLYSTHMIRPEALLCLDGIALMGCLWIGLEENALIWFLPAGILAGVAGGIHTNGIWFAVPCFALPLLEKRWRFAALAAAGWLLGLCAFIHFADWERFLPGVQTLFFREFSSPPLLTLHGNLFAAVADESDRYLSGWIFSEWRGGSFFQGLIGWQFLLYAAAVCWAFTQKGSVRRWAWAGSLLALAYALGVEQKGYNYSMVLEPFFIIPLAVWLTEKPIDVEWAIAGAALMLFFYPFGLLPLTVTLSFPLLKRRTAAWALLGLLLCLFLRINLLQTSLHSAALLGHRAWPLMLLGAALLAVCATRLRRRLASFSTASLAAGVTAIVTVGTFLFVGSVWSYSPPFPALYHQMAAAMTPGSRVAGPQELWLGLSEFDYRDIGGVMWYRLLLGQKDFLSPLKAFHPDYVIVDPNFISHLRRFNAELHVKGLQPPTGLFPWPHRVVNVWETGPAYGERWALIENTWGIPSPRDKK